MQASEFFPLLYYIVKKKIRTHLAPVFQTTYSSQLTAELENHTIRHLGIQHKKIHTNGHFFPHTIVQWNILPDNYLKSINRLFQRTANTRCYLKHLNIKYNKFFALFTFDFTLCKYFCKYPRMQQYVIFNVLKEYCISKEEEVDNRQVKKSHTRIFRSYFWNWKQYFKKNISTSAKLVQDSSVV
jgi:hypothetical protein